jgi:hypothetical protein
MIHDVIDGVAYRESSRVEGSQKRPASGVAGLFWDGQTGAGAVVSEKVRVLGRAGPRREPASGAALPLPFAASPCAPIRRSAGPQASPPRISWVRLDCCHGPAAWSAGLHARSGALAGVAALP